MLWLALRFPPLPPETLERIAAWTCQFTPRVSLEPPQALVAEVQGSLRAFGGPYRLAERIQDGLKAMGVEARFAMAPTARAALWEAGGEALPFEAEEVEFLRSLGISSLEEVLRLPRDGLARRFSKTRS